MTFRDIAFKNFRHNLKKYLSYFLCTSFSIMIFYMYAALYFNNNMGSQEEYKYIFGTGIFSVSVFAVFFVSYAHSAFIKSRYKEFGVYMTLGMDSRNIRRMILFENACVIFISLCLGFLSGILFSRLFQMAASRLIGTGRFRYSVNIKALVITLAVYAAIFLLVILQSSFSLRKLDIAGLYQKARKADNKKSFSRILGLIGITALLAGCSILFFMYYHRNFDGLGLAELLSIFLAFSGMYLIISNLGSAVLKFIRSAPSLYYKNLLTASEINQKFNQNKKILLVLSILSTMIILFVGMTFSMYSQAKEMAVQLQPNHLEYIELGEINRTAPEVLDKILRESGTPVTERKSIEFLSLNISGNTDQNDLLGSRPFIAQSVYNEINHTDLRINKGEAVSIVIPGSQIITNYAPELGMMALDLGTGGTYKLYNGRCLYADWVSGILVYPTKAGMVINDEDYAKIKIGIGKTQIGYYTDIQFEDWEKSKAAVEKVKAALDEHNRSVNSLTAGMTAYFPAASRIEFYQTYKHGYSLGIFILTIIGALFFIASANVLYFKQFSELPAAKEKFGKLYKIGITEAEITRVIAKEMRIIFFLPLGLAILPGLSNIWFANCMLGGEGIIGRLMLNACGIAAIYFILQAILYMIIKRSYCSQILKGL